MYIESETNDHITIRFSKETLGMMLIKDFDTMSIDEKNEVITVLAVNNGLLLHEVTPEFIRNYHKKMKIALLNEQCESAIEEGFTASNSHKYRTNRDDQINMIGQKDELNADETITIVPWKTEDVGYVEHTREEWLSIYTEAFSHKKGQLFKYNTLKGQVNAANSHRDIILIEW